MTVSSVTSVEMLRDNINAYEQGLNEHEIKILEETREKLVLKII